MKLKLATVAAALACGAALPPLAQAADLETVPFVIGNPLMIQAVPELYVPLSLGWFEQDGYDVKVQYMGGTSAAVQAIVGGSAQVGMMNSTPWIAAATKDLVDVKMTAVMANSLWRIITTKDSGITTPEQLKGKRVGLAVGGSGGSMYLDTLLEKHGMDPNTDVQKVVIGMGAQAQEMLESGRVDASLTFTPEIAAYEAMRGEVNRIYDPSWLRFPDYSFVATAEAFETKPDVVESLARNVVKAQVFLETNPECVAKIFRRDWAPERTTTIEEDTAIVSSFVEERQMPFENAGGTYRGLASTENLDELQGFLLQNGLITTKIDSKQLIPNDADTFYSRINSFDAEAVKAEALACNGY